MAPRLVDSVTRRNRKADVKIESVHQSVLQAEADHAAVESQLKRLEEEQDILEKYLDKYEKEVERISSDSTKPIAQKTAADRERERA
jgi:vacuolar-type H+-ATPase subunit E/Vma4